MITERPRTLTETERKGSRNNRLTILGIDSKTHTIYAQANGCHITAVCREKDNTDIYDRLKGILISSLLD